MSIVRAVIRQCAVAALRQKTWAEERVYDSNNAPLVDALTVGQDGKPYIVVFTDQDNMTDVTDGIYGSVRQLDLTIEMGVASAIEAKNESGVRVALSDTDPSMELGLDILEAQVLAAIYGDPQSEFGEIIRDLVIKVWRITSPRGGQVAKGTRFAARQVTLRCDVHSDPPPGVVFDSTHPIYRFIALAQQRNVRGVVDVAEVLESVLSHKVYPEWQQVQAKLGLRRAGIRGIGLAPLTDLAPGATPWAAETGADITASSGEGPVTAKVTLDDETTPDAPDSDVTPVLDPDPPDPLDESPHDSWPPFPPKGT